MDNSFLENSGKRGIGGIFRNYEGRLIIQFGKKATVNSAVHAKVLSLREELLVGTTLH